MGRKIDRDKFISYTDSLISELRRVNYFLKNTEVLSVNDDVDDTYIKEAIKKCDLKKVKEVFNFINKVKHIKELNKIELMEMAKSIGTVNYSRMSKYELYLLVKKHYKEVGGRQYVKNYRRIFQK